MSLKGRKKDCLGIIGIHQHRIDCVMGILPEERKQLQTLYVDVKIKSDFSSCLKTGDVKETLDYRLIAQACTRLAHENKYGLLELFASDILDHCLTEFNALWAWVCIQKPSAIPTASFAFVEFERSREV